MVLLYQVIQNQTEVLLLHLIQKKQLKQIINKTYVAKSPKKEKKYSGRILMTSKTNNLHSIKHWNRVKNKGMIKLLNMITMMEVKKILKMVIYMAQKTVRISQM